MRPIRLKIEGFTSFKKEVDIDFSELEVFAITGDNGAGKSSILEAVLFALYGKTHRLGKEKRDLVSLGSDKAAVFFEFDAGGNRYRIARSFKQKGNPFMKLEIQKAESWTTMAEQAQVNEEVEKILRMPFDAFTKAVLIPQGHFDALLKPREPKERRKTLIDLFDLGIYDRMKTRANEILRAAELEETQILQQFQSRYLDATPQKRKEIAREKKELAARSKELLKEKESLLKKQERVREVLTWKAEHSAATVRTVELQKQLAEFEAKAAGASKELEQACQVEARRIPDLERERLELSATMEKLQGFALKESALEDLDAALKKTRAEEAKARKELAGAEQERQAAAARVLKVQAQLSKHGYDENTFAQLQSSYDGLVNLRSLKKQLAGLNAKLSAEAKAVEALAAESAELEERRSGVDRRFQEAKETAERARREDEVLDLKLHLHAGDDCPVCGTHLQEPVKVSKQRIREIQEIRQGAEKKAEVLENELKQVGSRIAEKSAERRVREESLQKEEQRKRETASQVESLSRDLAAHLRIGNVAGVDEVALELYESQKKFSSGFRSLTVELRDAEKEESALEKHARELSATLQIRSAERERSEKQRESLASEMAELRARIPGEITPETTVRELVASLSGRRKEIGDQVERIRTASRNAEVALARIQQDEAHARKTLAEQQAALSKLQAHVDSLSQEESRYSELFAETLKAQIQTASADSSRVDHRLGEMSQQLEQMDRLLKEVKEQQERLETVKKDKETYGLLFKHLAGNHLQDYVVSALLEQLVVGANHFLKDLTQDRYLLDLEKDSFVVLDSWASGQSRIVDTLSGGESFVVSLALALALSDFMKGGAVLESLFIDEGFGSLHRDKLDLVYEALGALSGAGKMIGLVTHIEELAARFPARLHVSNTPSGSEVRLERTETNW